MTSKLRIVAKSKGPRSVEIIGIVKFIVKLKAKAKASRKYIIMKLFLRNLRL
jgi:hypothetical protein